MEPPIFLTVFLLFLKNYEILAQRLDCLASSTAPTLCATTFLQPSGQFIIPAIIKPLIAPIEPISQPPVVPSFPDFGSYPFYPPPMPPTYYGGYDDDDDWRHLLYILIFALTNKLGGGSGYGSYGYPACDYGYGGSGYGFDNSGGGCGRGFGGGCCGGYNGGCCGGYGGGCSGGCDGGYCGACGGGYGGGCSGSFGGGCGGGCGGSCGAGCGGSYCGNCGGSCGGGCSYDCNFGSNAYNNCGGNSITYIPYPIPVPMNSPNICVPFGYPDTAAPPDDVSSTIPTIQASNDNDANEIRLIIRTECS